MRKKFTLQAKVDKKRGRPSGTGPYKEPTKVMRVPLSMVSEVKAFLSSVESTKIPLYLSKVSAGLPEIAGSDIERYINIPDAILENPQDSFAVRVHGESMIGANIYPNDILIADRSISPTHKKIVFACLNGEFIVKRLYIKGNTIKLISENEDFKDIIVKQSDDFEVIGVVYRSFRDHL